MKPAAKLDQIEGARALAAVWVVVHHQLRVDAAFDDERGGEAAPQTPFNAALGRAHIGVSFFVVLSGFITHWVYGRAQRWDGDLIKFYANRLDRVVLTSTLSMLVGAVLGQSLRVATPFFGDPAELTLPRLLSCVTYVCFYIDPQQAEWKCPNPPIWTVGALVPSWLLYPLYRRLLVAAERGGGATAAALLLLASGWGGTFGALLAMCAAEGFNYSKRQVAWAYYFPPAQLGDFMLGVVAAALALRAASEAPAPGEATPLQGAAKEKGGTGARVARWVQASWLGLVADGAALSLVCLVFLLPFAHDTHLTGWDPLLDHALAPLIGLWLLATSAGSPAVTGGFARVLRHPALASAGKYAFHVYLLHALVLYVAIAAGVDLQAAPSVVAVLLISWLLGGLYCEWVEVPLLKLCRTGASACQSRWSRSAVPSAVS